MTPQDPRLPSPDPTERRPRWARLPRCLLLCPLVAGAADDLILDERFHAAPPSGWRWEREEAAAWRSGPQGLELRVLPGNLWGRANNARNVWLHPVPDPAIQPLEITTHVHHRPTGQWEQVNLAWYYDASSMVKLGQELVSGKLSVVMGREEGDKTRTIGIVPLDATSVELRLLVAGKRIQGQYRTALWPDWREVGDCELPGVGPAHVSVHAYQGPPGTEHWARIERVVVRRLAATPEPLESRVHLQRSWKPGQAPPPPLPVPGHAPFLRVISQAPLPATAGAKADFENSAFLCRDGSYGWTWDRRAVPGEQPTFVGALLEAPGPAGLPLPLALDRFKSLEAHLDVITRLDVDRGQHRLGIELDLEKVGSAIPGAAHRLRIEFDWQGAEATAAEFDDGFRRYARPAPATGEITPGSVIAYRLSGLRGVPPRANLRAFLIDAAERAGWRPEETVVRRLRLGTEAWNGSKGRVHVRRFDLILDGRPIVSVLPPPAIRPAP
ncbi:MAG: hypothetical protein HZC55_06740 [Verrucomicrobia bacterium]|nr:hypothetical protein [Verrucomicrobiota bacterium]